MLNCLSNCLATPLGLTQSCDTSISYNLQLTQRASAAPAQQTDQHVYIIKKIVNYTTYKAIRNVNLKLDSKNESYMPTEADKDSIPKDNFIYQTMT